MKRRRIRDVLASPPSDGPITVCGWVRTKRTARRFAFVAVNDGSSQDTLQLVVDHGTSAFAALDEVGTGAAIRARGATRASPGAGQRIEMQADEIEVLGPAPAEYPLQKKGHTLEFLREIGHLRPRTSTFGAVFRIRNVLAAAVHAFFQQRGFVWAHTPIITGSDCEGAGEMFRVAAPAAGGAEFFGRPAHLTVSGQLEAEFMAMALGDVYTFGPTFRAENSNTSRHLSEFWMIEPEMAFADLDDDAALAEDFLKAMCRAALDQCGPELAFLEKHHDAASAAALRALSESTFARLTYTEAADALRRAADAFRFPHEWGQELGSEHERHLTERVCGGPVIVTDYPRAIKPFYMRLNDDGETVAAMDVLAPRIGEIVGGSQREERLAVLERRMDELGLDRTELSWYCDLRRFGSAEHAGFGLGFERLVQYVTGMANIRDVIPCPRAPGSIGFQPGGMRRRNMETT